MPRRHVASRCAGLATRSVSRSLRVAGVGMEPGVQDVIGLSRVKFQGLIAAEPASVGYRLVDLGGSTPASSADTCPNSLPRCAPDAGTCVKCLGDDDCALPSPRCDVKKHLASSA